MGRENPKVVVDELAIRHALWNSGNGTLRVYEAFLCASLTVSSACVLLNRRHLLEYFYMLFDIVPLPNVGYVRGSDSKQSTAGFSGDVTGLYDGETAQLTLSRPHIWPASTVRRCTRHTWSSLSLSAGHQRFADRYPLNLV